MLLRLRNSFALRKRLTSAVADGGDAGRVARLTPAFLSRFAAKFLSRLTEKFRSRAVAVVADARVARFTATSRCARNCWFLCAFRSRILSFRARFRSRTARKPVFCLVTAFELVCGLALDRCRVGAVETLRCALTLLPLFAGRAV